MLKPHSPIVLKGIRTAWTNQWVDTGYEKRFHPEHWPEWVIKILTCSRRFSRFIGWLSDVTLRCPANFLLQCRTAITDALVRGYTLRGWLKD